LSQLTAAAVEEIQINGTIATTGSQSYNAAVVLGSATVCSSMSSGGISFNATVTGGTH